MKLTQCANGCGVVLPALPKGKPEPVCGACLVDGENRKKEAERRRKDPLMGKVVIERDYD